MAQFDVDDMTLLKLCLFSFSFFLWLYELTILNNVSNWVDFKRINKSRDINNTVLSLSVV
jgi:hypothetical protein